MNNLKLKALITGGTSGLGKSIAEGFADAGYEVIATGVGKIPRNKNNIEFCSLDVLDETSIKKKIEKCATLSKWGKISWPSSSRGAKNKNKEKKNKI